MFQTKLDRWLIETFVYEHHILVMQIPNKLPYGVKKIQLPAENRSGFTHRLEIKSQKKATRIINSLQEQGLSFKTQISEKPHWYNWLINNKHKSFTFRVFWLIIFVVVIFFSVTKISAFMKTERFSDIKKQFQRVLAPSQRS